MGEIRPEGGTRCQTLSTLNSQPSTSPQLPLALRTQPILTPPNLRIRSSYAALPPVYPPPNTVSPHSDRSSPRWRW